MIRLLILLSLFWSSFSFADCSQPVDTLSRKLTLIATLVSPESHNPQLSKMSDEEAEREVVALGTAEYAAALTDELFAVTTL